MYFRAVVKEKLLVHRLNDETANPSCLVKHGCRQSQGMKGLYYCREGLKSRFAASCTRVNVDQALVRVEARIMPSYLHEGAFRRDYEFPELETC